MSHFTKNKVFVGFLEEQNLKENSNFLKNFIWKNALASLHYLKPINRLATKVHQI
jgi:hypothetical protein